MMFYLFLGLLFGAIVTDMRSRLKEIETYRAHLDDLVNRGALVDQGGASGSRKGSEFRNRAAQPHDARGLEGSRRGHG